ncbi:hypothetical protein SKAU_G00103860 [Synaphobranchus kaupii]|uniref:Uncharacterized protein n=1 Tax=Synaphobranchus kaupii TaxID=118154 RepID=A0A9Q1FYX1_SYNKA|nr:hypothetical protein SKAU_G00103860 [Synaphobranchus kaupii]
MRSSTLAQHSCTLEGACGARRGRPPPPNGDGRTRNLTPSPLWTPNSSTNGATARHGCSSACCRRTRKRARPGPGRGQGPG